MSYTWPFGPLQQAHLLSGLNVSAGTGSAVWTGVDASVTPGEVSVAAPAAIAIWKGVDASVSPGEVTSSAGVATAIWNGISASVTITDPSVNVDAAVSISIWNAISASVTPGEVSVAAAAAAAVWKGADASVSPGEVSVPAAAATAVWSGQDVSVTPGDVSVSVAVATAKWTAPPAGVQREGDVVTTGIPPWRRRGSTSSANNISNAVLTEYAVAAALKVVNEQRRNDDAGVLRGHLSDIEDVVVGAKLVNEQFRSDLELSVSASDSIHQRSSREDEALIVTAEQLIHVELLEYNVVGARLLSTWKRSS